MASSIFNDVPLSQAQLRQDYSLSKVNQVALAIEAINVDVQDNAANIQTNTDDIAINSGDIATNTGNIATNTGAIATNTGNIATNTGGIATNTGNIANNNNGVITNAAKLDVINGLDANNKIIVGNAANVPLVDNLVVIGNGDKTNAKAKDILLGNGVTVAGADLAGTLHIGNGMSDVVADPNRASTHYIPIYYNGAFYRLPVSNVGP